jgi:hypothetical protein
MSSTRLHVEMAVAGEVEEDRALRSFFPGAQSFRDRPGDSIMPSLHSNVHDWLESRTPLNNRVAHKGFGSHDVLASRRIP